MNGLLGLTAPVVDLVYVSLWLLLPWPAAIGYRRFLHGLLIRDGLTRRVAYGTLLRLGSMAAVAAGLYLLTDLPGAWVGAIALSAGVSAEAVAARAMAAGVIRRLLGEATGDPTAAVQADPATAATGDPAGDRHAQPYRALPEPATVLTTTAASAQSSADAGAGAEDVAAAQAAVQESPRSVSPGYRDIARFYYPLALTSFIGLTVHPLLTFFMGRAPRPVESLAVFPVVHALSFVFRAAGFSFQEAVIALSGRRFEHIPQLIRFGITMAVVSSGGMALVAFTPLAGVWFELVSGLPPELAAAAVLPARLVVPLPAMAVLMAFQQAVLVQDRGTRPITYASGLEVASIAVLFLLLSRFAGMSGVSAAMLALVGGRFAGNLYLMIPVRAALARGAAARAEAARR
jgi:hypothetical protein